MIEVFKTNVVDATDATLILDSLHCCNVLYVANFDLEDRDRILRIRCLVGDVDTREVVAVLQRHGFLGEVLPDDVPILQVDILR
ncbi:MAG: hypothetical protein QM762_20715 [Chryseolinea sp.]